MIGRLIALLFLSREYAHRAHLKTTSYAQHVALGEFYPSIGDIADTLTEAYQGRYEIIQDIPMLEETDKGDPADVLSRHLDSIEKMRYTAVEKTDTPLQNIIDEAVAQYLSTLYKLRNLK
jgi:nucleoside-diphosphate-sugar epimerase